MSNDPTTNTYLGEIVAVLHEIRDRLPSERPESCCGDCPPIVGGGYDCTCDERCDAREAADTPPAPTSATQDAPAGRIGWLRLMPDDAFRYLMREVEGGWSGDDSDAPDYYPAEDYPGATFTPIATLPEGYVAVERDALDVALGWHLDNSPYLKSRLSAALEGGRS